MLTKCPFDWLAAEVTSRWGAEVREGVNATHRAQLRGTRVLGVAVPGSVPWETDFKMEICGQELYLEVFLRLTPGG